MQKMKTQQVEVTRSRETAADLVRRLERSAQTVELVRGGRVVARVVPAEDKDYVDATPAERNRAWKEVQKIQRKVGRMMKRTGKTEDELMKIILEDD